MTKRETEERHDLILSGVPEGLDALVLSQLVREPLSDGSPGLVLHLARDDRRLDALETALKFFAPDAKVIAFPAWDTVPYDRVGPNADIVAQKQAKVIAEELEKQGAPKGLEKKQIVALIAYLQALGQKGKSADNAESK